ncbi:hypothetical protein J2S78_003001 [Salibacterium salarium]|uniref:Uncharacterized protein n=1 Tax=Salibacterium salarium TaxID=284579 RepID=A0A3R9P4Q8_9BACI|nr:hypothetical protein [Salibacterium salarium]MDQ0300533.1 hypothetical protein [Salibacterium salarium]RSL30265.1 hypothetical protein D7Z54_27065 [Salibacterium salarium]
MNVFIGALLVLWGLTVLYASLSQIKTAAVGKDKGVVNVSGFLEWELLFKVLHKFPVGFLKGFTLVMGISFVLFGIYVMLHPEL